MFKKIAISAAATALFGAAFAANPLLTAEGYLKVDFTPQQMQQYADDAQKFMDNAVAAITKMPRGQRTFQNTYGDFERALNEYHNRTQFLVLSAHISPNADIRKKSLEIRSAVSKYLLTIFTHKELYVALKNERFENLSPQDQRVMDIVLLEFEKSGMNLSDKDLAKFIKIKRELIDLETGFDETLSASKAYITLKPEEMKGLSSTMIASMSRDKNGNFVLDITPRSVYFAFLASSEIDAKRKEAERNYQAIGGKKNLDTLAKMMKARKQIADIFQFDNFSDYVLQDKMAGKYATAMAFSADLVSKMQIKAAMENDEFLKFKRAATKDPSAIALTEWDWRFYSAMYKKQNLNIDDEKIKEYFPLLYVIDNMLQMFGKVYNVQFEPVNVPVWHKDVMPYAVKEDGETVGYLYMDTIPREGKYTHAECDDVVIYRENPDGTKSLPVAVLVSNASLPGNGVPSLLSTTEMGTLFHEFGHATDFLFNRSPYGGLTSGLVRDFVEVPSKNLEYWAASPGVIKKFSKHYITGEGLDDETIENLVKAKYVDVGNERLWFLTQVMFDLKIHEQHPATPKAIMDVWTMYNQQVRNRPMIDGGMRPAGFGHVAWGYASLYYGYDWADIIAADIFSVFDEAGLDHSTDNGKAYRDLILSSGNARDPNEQVEKFLGRPFNNTAYFKYMTGMDFGKK